MINWKSLQQSYEIVKSGSVKKLEGENFKVYSMGQNNPVIRIDIKE